MIASPHQTALDSSCPTYVVAVQEPHKRTAFQCSNCNKGYIRVKYKHKSAYD